MISAYYMVGALFYHVNHAILINNDYQKHNFHNDSCFLQWFFFYILLLLMSNDSIVISRFIISF